MPRGDKRKYTDKENRQAERLEKDYEQSGLSSKEASRRARETVSAVRGGGDKPGGSSYGRREDEPERNGGRIGGRRSARGGRGRLGSTSPTSRGGRSAARAGGRKGGGRTSKATGAGRKR
jgi:hypothetical protein